MKSVKSISLPGSASDDSDEITWNPFQNQSIAMNEKIYYDFFKAEYELIEMRSLVFLLPHVVFSIKNIGRVEYEVVLSNLPEYGWTWILTRRNTETGESVTQKISWRKEDYVFRFLCRWWKGKLYDALIDRHYELYWAPKMRETADERAYFELLMRWQSVLQNYDKDKVCPALYE